MSNEILPRTQFLEQLQRLCDQAQLQEKIIGLLVVDLLEFRRVNAVYGYHVGDKVLADAQQRMQDAGFKDSALFRIGNDEFALVLSGVKDPKLLTLAANKVVRVISVSFEYEQCMVRLEPVIGIAVEYGKEFSAEHLLASAEKNLTDARRQNKRFLPFTVSETKRATNWQFESALHQAVAGNDLSLFYQPKIHIESGLPTHAEALARWKDPVFGTIGPAEFIPILEKTGGIADMTKWAIHTALRELRDWPGMSDNTDYSVAVNVSSQVLEDSEFPELVKSALSIWGVDPWNLTLEITEGTLVQEEHSSYQSIYRLKDLGLKISIDDFGTGYSCLSYFKRIPADELKIDQSFVTNIQKDKDDEHLTRVIIDLAHKFNMSVVAEGVEDRDTFLKLDAFGCDYVQGFYFSRPLPQEQYCRWLENFKKKTT